MGHAYSLRFRLRPRLNPNEASRARSSTGSSLCLTKQGIADDISDLGLDGTYALWLNLVAESPEDAVGAAISQLYLALNATRPDWEPDQIVSIEISLEPNASAAESTLLSTT